MLGTEQVVFRNTFRIDAVPLLSKMCIRDRKESLDWVMPSMKL